MGEALIEGTNWKLVELGRVVLCKGGELNGRLGAIVEIVDHKRVLIEGVSSDPALQISRQAVPLSQCLLSSLVVKGLPRGARQATLKKFWEKSEIDTKWQETNWAKKRAQMAKRRNLTDFDRFKVMRLKKQRRFEERKALAKVKAAA